MRTLAALLTAAILVSGRVASWAGDVQAIEVIDNAAAQLDEAFEAQDAAAVKALTTPDHLAVTHYYQEPRTVEQQIASLPDLKYQQTNITEPTVTLLGAEAAMRRPPSSMAATRESPCPRPSTSRRSWSCVMANGWRGSTR